MKLSEKKKELFLVSNVNYLVRESATYYAPRRPILVVAWRFGRKTI